MEKILALTDLSDTAEKAAVYACLLAGKLNCNSVVLYHSYATDVRDSEAGWVGTHEDMFRKSAMDSVRALGGRIRDKLPAGVQLQYRVDPLPLEQVDDVIREEAAGLVVMGTAGKSKLAETIFGSNCITVCDAASIPVMLVPPEMETVDPGQLVFACDMKEIRQTVPEAELKTILSELHLPLTVLNIENEQVNFTPETVMETSLLHDILKDHDPAYYNIKNDDVSKGIMEFAGSNPGTIVLLISKEHDMLQSVFHKSVTKELAHRATFPLMVLKEHQMAE